jgi:hypothetical protein
MRGKFVVPTRYGGIGEASPDRQIIDNHHTMGRWGRNSIRRSRMSSIE